MSTSKGKAKPVKVTQDGLLAVKGARRSWKDKGNSVPQPPSALVSQVSTAEHEFCPMEVKWRPDLTALKRLILNRAGIRFQHNDIWVEQFNRKRAKRLIEEGQFVPGEDAVRFDLNIGDFTPESSTTWRSSSRPKMDWLCAWRGRGLALALVGCPHKRQPCDRDHKGQVHPVLRRSRACSCEIHEAVCWTQHRRSSGVQEALRGPVRSAR